jgi:CoA:oxalate CoA-transferase
VTGEAGRPPARLGIPLADLSGGIFTNQGVLAALFDRERTGRGRRIDVSMFDAMLHLLTYMGTMWLTNGELSKPSGSAHDYTVPWQAFAASDGYFVLAAREPAVWRRLCQVLGEPGLADDPKFATGEKRVQNRTVLVPHLENIFRARTVADWLELLRAADVPAAPVNHFDKAFAEPPVAEREMIVEYDHPDVGKVRLPGNPIKMSDMSATISDPAPRLGEHTNQVLSQLLSMSAEEIDALRKQGAIS